MSRKKLAGALERSATSVERGEAGRLTLATDVTGHTAELFDVGAPQPFDADAGLQMDADLRDAARSCLAASIAAGHLPAQPSPAVIADIADFVASNSVESACAGAPIASGRRRRRSEHAAR